MKTGIGWRVIAGGVMLAFGLAGVVQAAEKLSPKERTGRDAVCTECHDETETTPILAIYQTPHGAIGDQSTPSCQACHGESKEHLGGAVGDKKKRPRPDKVFGSRFTTAGYEPDSAQQQSETCLACHKAGLRKNWPGSQHQTGDVPCSSCHVSHTRNDQALVKAEQPKVCFSCHPERRADIKKISSHPIEAGKMTCSDCHNPHGSAGPKMLAKSTLNETCLRCHAERRGPFLWEHQPVNEDCTTCHASHGSNISPLLKSRPPFLCAECHSGPHNSGAAYGFAAAGRQAGVTGAPNNNTVGRACMNCHVMVHGSNSPTGAFLHR